MNGLKVVFLFTPGPIGGAEKIILHGIEALTEQIQNLELWILKDEKNFEVTHQFLKLIERVGVNYRVYSMDAGANLRTICELREDFKDHAPDIIHTHGIKAAIYGRIAANPKAKFIISHHSPTSYSFKEKFFESIEKVILKKADAIITASDKVKADLLNSNVPTEKLFVVENLLTAKIRDYISRAIPKIRIIYAGKLDTKKRLPELIEAIKDTDLELIFLGEGEERAILERMVNELKLNRRIKFLGFKKDVAPYLSQSHGIIVPEHEYELPPSFIEASCIGIPTIIIKNEDSKLDILARLNEFEENQEFLFKEAQEKKNEYLNRFSPEKWAKNILDIYVTTLSHQA